MARELTSKKPSICFVAQYIYPTLAGANNHNVAGGGEAQQSVLAKVLAADGYRVSVITGDYGQPRIERHGGIEIYRVDPPGARGITGLRFLYPLSTDIVKLLRQVDPDIVYFCVAGFRAAAPAWYAKRYGKKFVYQCGSDREFLKPIPGMAYRDAFMFRYAMRAADEIILQNVRQAGQLQASFGRRGMIIPTLYVEDDVGHAKWGSYTLWAGMFKPIKRPDRFIDLARRHPEQRFVMIGGADSPNDPGNAYYLEMKERAIRVKNLTFVGYVSFAEVRKFFNEASVLVNTSDSEGFPNTFMEAWIRGVPTLSFVSPEIVPGRTGTIACRDIDDMSQQLRLLTGSEEAWQVASREALQNFEETHSRDAVLPLYRRMLNSLV